MLALPLPSPQVAEAAHDAGIGATTGALATPLQMVVLETEDCTICVLFRRYIVPAYSLAPRAKDVPLKFVDMNDKAYDELNLDGPVSMLPTAILMQNNREVGRISGYMGPENFFHAMKRLMARLD